ncbi:MAG TPA: hypothetical protein VFG47_01770 [Geminicoccaceae bacterium]|nr:hypothetical protein [Geminicoccaceae bacterium]
MMNREAVSTGPNLPPPTARREAAEWREAERLLGHYFEGFGLSDPHRLDRLVDDTLARVPLRRAGDDVAAAALAAAEARVAAWFARVLGRGERPEEEQRAAALAGRAAFLLCDGPTAWPDAFLSERPPQAFVAALRLAAPEPTPPPEPSVMPAQDLRPWSTADLVPTATARAVRPLHAALGVLLSLAHWR